MIKMINKKAKVHVQGPLTSCFLYSPLLGNDWTGESLQSSMSQSGGKRCD
jgi:hypothetical protein